MNTHELKEILERLELNSLHSTVDFVDLYEAASRRPSFTFTGEFSSGKTSLIEQLLGETVGKVDILEATRLPILFVYGTQKQAYGFQNKKQVEMINFEELNGASGQLHSPYDWLLVSLPNETLKTFNVVDTPGTNGSSTHQVSFVPNLQYVFCSPYGEVMTETKQQTLEKLGNQDIYFVATKADLVDLDEQEEIEEMHEEILEDYSFKDQIIYSILDTEIVNKKWKLRAHLKAWASDSEMQQSKTEVTAQVTDNFKDKIVNQILVLLKKDDIIISPFIASSKKQDKKESELVQEHEAFQIKLLNRWRIFNGSNGSFDTGKIIQEIEKYSILYKNKQYEPQILDISQSEILTLSEKNMIRLKSDIIKIMSIGMKKKSLWTHSQIQLNKMKECQTEITEKCSFINKLRERSLHSRNQCKLIDHEEKAVSQALNIFGDRRWYDMFKNIGLLNYDINIQNHYHFIPKLDVRYAIKLHSYIMNITELEYESIDIRRSNMLKISGNGIDNSEAVNLSKYGLKELDGQHESSPWRANHLLLKQLKKTKKNYMSSEKKWFLNQEEHKKIIHQIYGVIGREIVILKEIINKNLKSELYSDILKRFLNELQVVSNYLKQILQSKTYTYDVPLEKVIDSPYLSKMDYFSNKVMYPAFLMQSILLFVLLYISLGTDSISGQLDINFPSYFGELWFWIPSLGVAVIMTYAQHRMEDRKFTLIPVFLKSIYVIATPIVFLLWLSGNI